MTIEEEVFEKFTDNVDKRIKKAEWEGIDDFLIISSDIINDEAKKAIDLTIEKCEKEFVGKIYEHKWIKVAREEGYQKAKDEIKNNQTIERNKSIKDYQKGKISKDVHIVQINLLRRLDTKLEKLKKGEKR